MTAIVNVVLSRIYHTRDELNAVARKRKTLNRQRGVGTNSVYQSQ